jgi:hypothetical protein
VHIAHTIPRSYSTEISDIVYKALIITEYTTHSSGLNALLNSGSGINSSNPGSGSTANVITNTGSGLTANSTQITKSVNTHLYSLTGCVDSTISYVISIDNDHPVYCIYNLELNYIDEDGIIVVPDECLIYSDGSTSAYNMYAINKSDADLMTPKFALLLASGGQENGFTEIPENCTLVGSYSKTLGLSCTQKYMLASLGICRKFVFKLAGIPCSSLSMYGKSIVNGTEIDKCVVFPDELYTIFSPTADSASINPDADAVVLRLTAPNVYTHLPVLSNSTISEINASTSVLANSLIGPDPIWYIGQTAGGFYAFKLKEGSRSEPVLGPIQNIGLQESSLPRGFFAGKNNYVIYKPFSVPNSSGLVAKLNVTYNNNLEIIKQFFVGIANKFEIEYTFTDDQDYSVMFYDINPTSEFIYGGQPIDYVLIETMDPQQSNAYIDSKYYARFFESGHSNLRSGINVILNSENSVNTNAQSSGNTNAQNIISSGNTNIQNPGNTNAQNAYKFIIKSVPKEYTVEYDPTFETRIRGPRIPDFTFDGVNCKDSIIRIDLDLRDNFEIFVSPSMYAITQAGDSSINTTQTNTGLNQLHARLVLKRVQQKRRVMLSNVPLRITGLKSGSANYTYLDKFTDMTFVQSEPTDMRFDYPESVIMDPGSQTSITNIQALASQSSTLALQSLNSIKYYTNEECYKALILMNANGLSEGSIVITQMNCIIYITPELIDYILNKIHIIGTQPPYKLESYNAVANMFIGREPAISTDIVVHWEASMGRQVNTILRLGNLQYGYSVVGDKCYGLVLCDTALERTRISMPDAIDSIYKLGLFPVLCSNTNEKGSYLYVPSLKRFDMY